MGLEEFRSARDLDAIAQSIATPPFLAIRRLVMIWDPLQLTGGQRASHEAEALGATLGTRLESTAVVVVHRGVLPASSPLLQAMRVQRGEVRLLKRPKGRELRRYVDDQVQTRGLHLGQAVLTRLAEVAAQDIGQLHQELEKLQLFMLGGGRIADSDALLLIPPAPPTELYRLTDALFEEPGRVGERLRQIAGTLRLSPSDGAGRVGLVSARADLIL